MDAFSICFKDYYLNIFLIHSFLTASSPLNSHGSFA